MTPQEFDNIKVGDYVTYNGSYFFNTGTLLVCTEFDNSYYKNSYIKGFRGVNPEEALQADRFVLWFDRSDVGMYQGTAEEYMATFVS